MLGRKIVKKRFTKGESTLQKERKARSKEGKDQSSRKKRKDRDAHGT